MEPSQAVAKAEAEEDPPIVKALKELDDKYLALKRECDKELEELQKRYEEKQRPMLEQRTQVLSRGEGSSGTPALTSFWLKAMQHHPAFEDEIEEHDEPVLEYLRDITKELLDPSESDKGFRITFHFIENPFFSNETLVKEYHTKEGSPYTGELEVTKLVATEINWKPGKDVTVEKVAKKVKGGGAKKAKAKDKGTTEPRPSLFRSFFRSLEKGEEIPEDIMDPEMLEGMGEMDEDELAEQFLEAQYDTGCALRDQIIPYAVRWYTGEAAPDDDDDDDEDEEEEEEDSDDEEDDDDDDDDDDDRPAPKPGKKAAPKAKGGKESGKDAPKPEECKQQ